MRRILDWVGTILFLPVFGLTLVVFDVLQRLAKACGKRPHDYMVACMCTALVTGFRITGLRLRVERHPTVRSHRPYVIISNHQSMFDIALLGHVFFSNFPKYVSKRELAKWIPSVSYNLKRGGSALINRGDPVQAVAAIHELGARVERNGVSAVIFPEGTRARRGELGVFKPRGTLALLESTPTTAVVPVTIDESWRLMRANFLPVPFGTHVRIRIGAPIPRQPGEDHEALLERVRDEIAATLADFRGERSTPPRIAAAR
ncbi:MAG TPA: lysophospholipid acyltransferase family protein [Candidatus Binatia bacterium]|jgi:1-acyl-sn-glycerol-3-phosphate acyltransferase